MRLGRANASPEEGGSALEREDLPEEGQRAECAIELPEEAGSARSALVSPRRGNALDARSTPLEVEMRGTREGRPC